LLAARFGWRDDRRDEREGVMPHNFIKLPPTTPNPGPWTREKLEGLCTKHGCRLEHAWSERHGESAHRYVLVEYGGPAGNMKGLHDELGAEEVVELYEPAAG
jgi:hypothetical protein